MGRRVEAGGGEILPKQLPGGDAWQLLQPPRRPLRPRPDLHRFVWPQIDADHLRLPSERAEDVGVPDRPARRDRAENGAASHRQETAHRPLYDHRLPDDPHLRRRDHGNRPDDQRAEPLPAKLGCLQPLRHGRDRLPAKRRLQPDRHGRRAGLLVGGRNRQPLSEGPGPAGPELSAATGDATKRACLHPDPLPAAVRDGPGAPRQDRQDYQQIANGRYLATLGDCTGCHTEPGSKPYAGGLALATPFGKILAPNITPDRETGIGAWSDDDFVNALLNGTGHGGERLYPAMPYPL